MKREWKYIVKEKMVPQRNPFFFPIDFLLCMMTRTGNCLCFLKKLTLWKIRTKISIDWVDSHQYTLCVLIMCIMAQTGGGLQLLAVRVLVKRSVPM